MMTASSSKTPERADWDVLALLGAPILARSQSKAVASGDLLSSQVQLASEELAGKSQGEDFFRKLESLQALLMAVQSHFPQFFNERLDSPETRKLFPKEMTGRLIRLRRQALARICEYL
jgi:hypothetical protein